MLQFAQKLSPGASRPAEAAPLRAATQRPLTAVADLAGLVALALSVFFFHLGSYGLWPDEARYAEIAREMLATRDFVLPHLNYVAYVEKPPLLYWLTALSFRAFGLTEFAARLPVAIGAIVGLLATYFFALRTFDRRHALLSGAILATTPLYAAMAQVLTTDMLLATLMTVAFFAFFLHWSEGGRWCWVFYLATALGVLTKGPVGAVIPAVVGVAFLWWQGELGGGLVRFKAVPGMVLVIAISAPWFIAVTVREPDFFSFYFVGEHLRRFFEPSYSHGEPIYFYIPVLAAGLLPWSLMVPLSAWRKAIPSSARRFCVVAAGIIFVFFSLASAKLISYILPAVPPFAVLIADGILSRASPQHGGQAATARGPGDSQIFAAVGPVLGLIGAGVVVTAMLAPYFRSPYPNLLRPVLGTVGPILLVGGVSCAAAFWGRRTAIGLSALVLTTAAALLAGSYGRLMAEPMRSYAALSRAVEAKAPDAKIICYRRYEQTLPFYTRRRVILVGAKTELRFGAAHSADARDHFFTSDADLLRLWKRPRPTVVVLDATDLNRLGKQLGDFIVIASESKKRAILNSGERAGAN